MATIGPFDNVPEPGAPIRSPWPQETATVITGLLAQQARYKFTPGAGGSSAGAISIANQVWSAAELPVPGVIVASVWLQVNLAGGSTYRIVMQTGAGVEIVKRLFTVAEMGLTNVFVSMLGALAVPGGVGATVNISGVGSANVTVGNDPTINRLDGLYIPNVYVPT